MAPFAHEGGKREAQGVVLWQNLTEFNPRLCGGTPFVREEGKKGANIEY